MQLPWECRFVIVLVLGALVSSACSETSKSAPPREELEALLNQEATNMKQEAEAEVNPALGVTVTWTVEGVELREQPGNEAEPWLGTIHFTIESKTPELDGTATERFERTYDYAWDLESETWAMR